MASNENNHDNITINWNNIINHDTRSIDDADLGKVQGLFEPFVVTEKGTINKEKFYIPKSLFQRYDGEVLCFNITEQQAKDTCMRSTPPSEDEAKQIVMSITEKREEKEEKADGTKTIVVKEKGKNQQIKKLPTSMSLSRQNTKEEEIVKKIKIAANDLKVIILSGAKVAKQKIKERQETVAEKQADKDAKQISKMGDLATQFATAFEDILSEIRTRTYAEQEQIYTGFLKLMEQQHGLVSARRNLASKLKGSVRKPALATTTAQPSLRGKEQPRLSKEAELPPPHPQLPEMINPPPRTNTITTKEKLKTKAKTKKLQVITASKKESPEQIRVGKFSSSITEPIDRENPTQKQKITETTTNDGNDATTKKGKGNR
jgi:hypothetical protein